MFDQPEHRAAERLAAARRLVARGKLRDALDALNLAIQLAPGNPEAFRERAGVFDKMGLFPQAEADRRRADELAAMLPPAFQEEEPLDTGEDVEELAESWEDIEGTEDPDLPEEIEEPKPPMSGAKRGGGRASEPPIPPWHPEYDQGPIPADIPREGDRRPGLGALVFALLAIALFIVVVGAGVLLAVDTLGGDDGSSGSTPTPSGVAGDDGSATPTGEPTATGSPSTAGSPYSLANVVAAWQAKGMTVEAGGAGEGFAGFEAAPAEVTMSRGGSTAATAIFVYDSPDEAQGEWDLVPGSRPAPKGNRTLPAHVSAWWNANVVVVLRTDPGGLGPDALDGLINLGG